MSGFTFTRGFATIDPNIQTPYVLNWTIGYQRELWSDAAIEVRYVGNRGSNLWRGYNLNETNIFENGFLDEFRNAQRNLAINLRNGRTGFANNGLPGQVARCRSSTRRSARAAPVPPCAAASGYHATARSSRSCSRGRPVGWRTRSPATSATSVAMVGNALPGVHQRAATTRRARTRSTSSRPTPTPPAATVRLLTDEAQSKYDSLQLQFRQRFRQRLQPDGELHLRQGPHRSLRSSAPTTSPTTPRCATSRLNWGPTAYDLRHMFQAYGTYELPFGKGPARSTSRTRSSIRSLGGWAASGDRPHPDRPSVPADQRPSDASTRATPASSSTASPSRICRRWSTSVAGPNGNVFFFDESLIGADGRANPDFIALADDGRRARPVRVSLRPWLLDRRPRPRQDSSASPGGSRFNFEALFINAFNHRNSTRRRHRRRVVQHRLDDVRPDRRRRRTTGRVRFSSGSGSISERSSVSGCQVVG